jgi:ribosomal protein L23
MAEVMAYALTTEHTLILGEHKGKVASVIHRSGGLTQIRYEVEGQFSVIVRPSDRLMEVE